LYVDALVANDPRAAHHSRSGTDIRRNARRRCSALRAVRQIRSAADRARLRGPLTQQKLDSGDRRSDPRDVIRGWRCNLALGALREKYQRQ